MLDTRTHVVHHLTGDTAEAARLLRSGVELDAVPDALLPALASLRAAGLLDEPALPDRRRLLRLGVGAAVGLTTLALPSAAAAASIMEAGGGGGGGGGGVFYTLSVSLAGGGSGRVVSNPIGIDTGGTPATTSSPFGGASSVTLTATAGADSTFEGWSGDASGSDTTTSVTMDANKTVTATFSSITVSSAAAGNGQVSVSWNEL